ncbi:putative sterigmatocystin 8-o-methyltransferase protein [Botryosphaeria dothidea]|uniref:Sterigmatocystin 8-o-methyltransferase protein n=1 Tax=Botryosphaeria dothidea TaxID=55169 RepID=A0A8H4IRN9_9PEZI|nr:putative sterigmatocystin 8-o-methyltransferase protein [Botryosphaeria dothidea]
MADSQQPTLNGIAAKITELSETLTKYLKENNVPAPTFAADSPTSYSNLSPEIFMIRQALLDSLNDMWYLTQGPSESIFNYVHCGSASYAEIAQRVSLPEDVVQRVIQHGTTLRIFAETEPGKKASRVQHTSRSAALARNSGLRALTSTILDDAGAPMMVLNEALQRYSRGKPALTQDMSQTAFALFHSGGVYGQHTNSWDLLEKDGEGDKKGWRSRNFVEFMRYVKEIFHLEGVVLDSHDWKSVGKATVVDVGGSAGHDAVVLARNFPELSITVQDLSKVKSEFDASVPEEFRDRVKFMEHDFFQPQPVQADVYMFKMILHDWPDQEAAKILRALVPSLKPGARVLLFEYIGSHDESGDGPALPRSIQQMGTATDLRLMALFNAKERPVDAWKHIFKLADERFEVSSVKANPQQNFFAVIEAVWRG